MKKGSELNLVCLTCTNPLSQTRYVAECVPFSFYQEFGGGSDLKTRQNLVSYV